MIHLYIYFHIMYVEKFWLYIFSHIFLFAMIKENGGSWHAWPESDTRTGLQCRAAVASVRTTERGACNDMICRIERVCAN